MWIYKTFACMSSLFDRLIKPKRAKVSDNAAMQANSFYALLNTSNTDKLVMTALLFIMPQFKKCQNAQNQKYKAQITLKALSEFHL